MLWLGAFPARGADSNSGVRDIGSRLEPLVDHFLIERLEGAELRLHKPAAEEVAIVHNRPWEGNISAYHTVFQDGDGYKMYYRGAHYDTEQRKTTHRQLVCLAVSRDGIHWTKPNLGLVEFDGSKENNIIWDGIGSHNFAPFKDSNPDCPPAARYKALGSGDGGLYAFQSPDGIHWELMSEEPVITKGAFDSQNLAFWDSTRGRYVDFHRGFRNGVRDIMTATSEDFLNWTEPVWLEYPGAPAEHLYTNQILPYERAPHLFFGFPKRFIPDRNPTGHPNSGVSDGVFMTSRDGRRFHRWGEAIIRPGLQEERWVNRNNLTAWGILRTQSDIPGTPDELSIYSTEGYYTGEDDRLRRFTYRIDGFVSVQAPLSGGELITRPLVFSGADDSDAASEETESRSTATANAETSPVAIVAGCAISGRHEMHVNAATILNLPETQDLGRTATLAAHVRNVPAGHRRLFSSYDGGGTEPAELFFDFNSGGSILENEAIRFGYDGMKVVASPDAVGDWSAGLDPDAVHHLAATWNDGVVTLYFDGQEVAQGGEPGKGSLVSRLGNLRFGEDYPPTSLNNEPFLGTVDNLVVLRQALNPDQIRSLSQKGPQSLPASAHDNGLLYTMELTAGALVKNQFDPDGPHALQLPASPANADVKLLINYSTSAAGSIRCEIQDQEGRPLPGYSLEESDVIYGDEIARAVSWQGRTELKPLAGQAVRLRFVLKDADLYSLQFQ